MVLTRYFSPRCPWCEVISLLRVSRRDSWDTAKRRRRPATATYDCATCTYSKFFAAPLLRGSPTTCGRRNCKSETLLPASTSEPARLVACGITHLARVLVALAATGTSFTVNAMVLWVGVTAGAITGTLLYLR